MRLSMKLIGILWAGLLLIIGGLLFNAYSKLKPETFVSLLTEQVQMNYPGAKLSVGKISYRFSLDFKLELENIHLRRNDKLLGSIGEVELKIPWWLILFNTGNAQVNLSNLDVFIDHSETAQLVRSARFTDAQSARVIRLDVPSYISEAKFTLRAKHISIRDIQNARRYFFVSKLLVREFQYGKNSAFEINVPITIKHHDSQYLSDLWLFGDLTPLPERWSLNYRGEFRTKETSEKFQIEDLVIGGVATFVPSTLDISSQFSLLIEKKEIGTGTFTATQEKLEGILNFTKLPLNYFSVIYDDIRNPYLLEPEGIASGTLKYEKDFNDLTASLDGKLKFDGKLQLSEKDFIPGTWKIAFLDSRWEVSFISPKGEASYFRRSALDPVTNEVSQYVEELGFSGLDFGIVIAPVRSVPAFIADVPNIYFTSTISYKRCLLDDLVLDASFRYGHTPEQKYYTSNITNDKMSLQIHFAEKNSQNALDVNFTNFKWHPSFLFLNPVFQSQKGLLNGKILGRWNSGWESGQWESQLSVTQLQSASGWFLDLVSNAARVFDLNTINSAAITLTATNKNGFISIPQLLLGETNPARISGTLSTKQKSLLTLTYPKDKKVKALKKEVIEPFWIQKE